MRPAVLLVLVPLVPLASGCASDGGHASAPPAAPSASAAPLAPLPPGDPRVLALAKPVLACTLDPKTGFTRASCKAYAAWDEERELFKGGAADATLVGMLASANEAERLIAAEKLTSFGEKMPEDATLAGHVVAAAEREQSPRVGRDLGRAVAHVKLTKLGLADRALAIAAKHPNAALRAGLIERIAFANPDVRPRALEVFAQTVKDPDDEVRRNTVLGLWHASSHPAACKLLVGAFGDSVVQIGIDALRWVSYGTSCAAHFDAALAEVDRRIGAKKADSYEYGIVLADVCKRGTPEQKKRGAALARAILDGPFSSDAREKALTPVAVCDPGWKDVVGKYVSDKQADVAKRAKELLEKGPPTIW